MSTKKKEKDLAFTGVRNLKENYPENYKLAEEIAYDLKMPIDLVCEIIMHQFAFTAERMATSLCIVHLPLLGKFKASSFLLYKMAKLRGAPKSVYNTPDGEYPKNGRWPRKDYEKDAIEDVQDVTKSTKVDMNSLADEIRALKYGRNKDI